MVDILVASFGEEDKANGCGCRRSFRVSGGDGGGRGIGETNHGAQERRVRDEILEALAPFFGRGTEDPDVPEGEAAGVGTYFVNKCIVG